MHASPTNRIARPRQIYTGPPEREFVAIEPMTAEIDALGRGIAPVVEPGDRFQAAFNIAITTS